MDVKVDAGMIRQEREQRAWSQERFAAATGLGSRTVQRIEATGVASYESVRAIAAALGVPVARLRLVEETKSAPWRPRRTRLLLMAAAFAVVATSLGGFLLLKDYQQVRLLRTVESWVTEPAAVVGLPRDNRPDVPSAASDAPEPAGR